MIRWVRDRYGDYVNGPYRLIHLKGRGGWSSRTVEKDSRYVTNVRTLVQAKREAQRDAERKS